MKNDQFVRGNTIKKGDYIMDNDQFKKKFPNSQYLIPNKLKKSEREQY